MSKVIEWIKKVSTWWKVLWVVIGIVTGVATAYITSEVRSEVIQDRWDKIVVVAEEEVPRNTNRITLLEFSLRNYKENQAQTSTSFYANNYNPWKIMVEARLVRLENARSEDKKDLDRKLDKILNALGQ